MIDGCYLLGLPKSFKGICNIYAPTVKQIFENEEFYRYLSILTTDQETLTEQYKEATHIPTPMEMLLINSYADKQVALLICEAFEFFLHEPVLPLYETKAFLVGDPSAAIENTDYRLITEDVFFEFQNEIRICAGLKPLEWIPPEGDMDPRLRKMKLKKREAERVKAKQSQKTGEGATLEQNLVAIFCMGIGITPLNIGEMTYASVINIIQGYQTKESYDIEMRILTSGFGGKKSKTPKYWMTQI